MDLFTTLLFEAKGEVCGCLGFWGVGGTIGPEGEQLPGSYSSHHPGRLSQDISASSGPNIPPSPPTIVAGISSSPPTLSIDIISSPPKMGEESLLGIPQTDISGSFSPTGSSRYDLCSRAPTPSGPPKETCFFWYHGECRQAEKCIRIHETHITWPIPPPPKFVHWKPCHLPLCPLKEDMEELFKSSSNLGDRRTSPNTIGIDAVDSDRGVTSEADSNEQNSIRVADAAGDKDGEEIDVISLSSGSCSSTVTSPPPPSITQLAQSPSSRPIVEEPEVMTINHRSSIREKICFFWYHQGFCCPRRGTSCPCLHTLDTGAKEVSLPDHLKFHNLDCALSLCPVRLRLQIGKEIVVADKGEQEALKDVCWSMTPNPSSAPLPQVKTAPKKPLLHLGKKTLRQVQKQYVDQSNHLLQRYGRMGTPPKGPKAMNSQSLVIRQAANPNMVPLGRKRKASESEHQLWAHHGKRRRPTLFDAPQDQTSRFNNPALLSEFLTKSVASPKPRVEVKKTQHGVLVDYVLPSGEDRAEWDTDFLRRAFGEIQ